MIEYMKRTDFICEVNLSLRFLLLLSLVLLLTVGAMDYPKEGMLMNFDIILSLSEVKAEILDRYIRMLLLH